MPRVWGRGQYVDLVPPLRVVLKMYGKELGDFAFAPGSDDFHSVAEIS